MSGHLTKKTHLVNACWGAEERQTEAFCALAPSHGSYVCKISATPMNFWPSSFSRILGKDPNCQDARQGKMAEQGEDGGNAFMRSPRPASSIFPATCSDISHFPSKCLLGMYMDRGSRRFYMSITSNALVFKGERIFTLTKRYKGISGLDVRCAPNETGIANTDQTLDPLSVIGNVFDLQMVN